MQFVVLEQQEILYSLIKKQSGKIYYLLINE